MQWKQFDPDIYALAESTMFCMECWFVLVKKAIHKQNSNQLSQHVHFNAWYLLIGWTHYWEVHYLMLSQVKKGAITKECGEHTGLG